VALASIVSAGCGYLMPPRVSFTASAGSVPVYDFIEIAARNPGFRSGNPFTGAAFTGTFRTADGRKQWSVEGFCDSDDGSVYRIRFMPPAAGDYRYSLKYRQSLLSTTFDGIFRAVNSGRRGPVRVDPQNRWHFLWEGTGEHYFFNGITAYWLIGWRNEEVIRATIERLHRLKVNRIRVTVAGRTNTFYGEPVLPGQNWTSLITPWPAKTPEDIFHPGFDYRRFNLAYWQKFERALRFARDRDMIFSLVLDMSDSKTHSVPGGLDEHRFIHYAVARFGAFSNITWDLGDDLNSYRDDQWTHDTGTFLKQLDPYRHLATSHPSGAGHQDRTSSWFDFTSFQEWSRNQHAYMLAERRQQLLTARIIPQTNEEYGYEDHYPVWAFKLGPQSGDSADALRRTAWDIAMAGGYGTTGETARRGTNIWPDTGGGWLNGRGDGSMTMLEGYARMLEFFTAFEWWRTEPHDELVTAGSYCIAEPGRLYAIYLPHGGKVTVKLQKGTYILQSFDPQTGERPERTAVRGNTWTFTRSPTNRDMALLFRRYEPHRQPRK
jgi:hypothetical protein